MYNLLKLDSCSLIIKTLFYFVYMLLLLLLLVQTCRSEWPPVSCDPQVSVVQNIVTLTSLEQQEREYSCQLREKYYRQVFINFEKKYSARIFKKSHDSILGITISNKKQLFTLRIHNDRIESDVSKCFGIFTSTNIWLGIKLHPLLELRKTFISVHTTNNDVDVPCMNFETDGIVDEFLIKIHAITDTGMRQIVHNVVDKREQKNQTQLENEVKVIQERLRIVEQFVEHTERKLKENRGLVHNNHDEMKRTIQYSHTLNQQNVKTHSIVIMFCVGIISLILILCFKLNGYKHWSQHTHIL